MSRKAASDCPVCSKPFNDSTRLPLSSPCHHTHCLTCLRGHTLTSHPGTEAPREEKLPTGKEIRCLKCNRRINTDELVIDKAVLVKVPLSLEDLIIAEEYQPKPRPTKSTNNSTRKKSPATSPGTPATSPGTPATSPGTPPTSPGTPATNPGDSEHSTGDLEPSTPYDFQPPSPYPDDHRTSSSQGPAGWTLPTAPPPEASAMDPYQHQNPHQHPHAQPGYVGWAAPPGQANPQVPPHTGPYTQMPQPYGHPPHQPYGHAPYPHHGSHHSHHPHGHVVAAGAAGVAAGVATGVGVTALAAHKKKKKKKGKKNKKEKDRSRHRSSSSSSSGSSSSHSSKSSKSSNSS